MGKIRRLGETVLALLPEYESAVLAYEAAGAQLALDEGRLAQDVKFRVKKMLTDIQGMDEKAPLAQALHKQAASDGKKNQCWIF